MRKIQSASKLFEEWGINLSLSKKIKSIIPSEFFRRLNFVNKIVVFIATAISGWAIYNTACFLAAGVGDFNAQRQEQYNSTLLNYLWIFMIIAAIAGSLFHYFLIKRLIK